MKKIMNGFSKIKSRMRQMNVNQKINIKLSQGAAAASCRMIDTTNPTSWEFSGFSQNGEDGIIDFLNRNMINPNKYFLEIGASNGLENNSAWMAYALKYSGIMLDGNGKSIDIARKIRHNAGVEYVNMFVTDETVQELVDKLLYKDMDVLSLDIDGNDYYIMKTLLKSGVKPKLIVVEYNSAYGPDNKVTIEYDPTFDFQKASESQLYYGVAISTWTSYFAKQGYKFVTVDSNGVNAFFIDPTAFKSDFVENIKGVDFKENFYQMRKFGKKWDQQFELIKDMNLATVE